MPRAYGGWVTLAAFLVLMVALVLAALYVADQIGDGVGQIARVVPR